MISMGRGEQLDSAQHHPSGTVLSRSDAGARRATGEPLVGKTFREMFEEQSFEEAPEWREPTDYFTTLADQFRRPGASSGIEIDRAVAIRLMELELSGSFSKNSRWYRGSPKLVKSPEETVSGMMAAGEELAEAIRAGEKIAVFCDYDVDGTTAGEVFRRSVAPYKAKLTYEYASAQDGFGLTEEFVRRAAKAGCKTLITLDCGSSQTDQVALAQELGMRVVVVDHHHAEDSPADHHLNPKLTEPASSENTGAQLAWKLGAAIQMSLEEDGRARPDHWKENMYLAGQGFVADMGSTLLPENRAFLWNAADHPVPGIELLAERLGEDPTNIGSCVKTRACMNLPKRSRLVEAKDVGEILAAKSSKEAEKAVEKMLAIYEEAKPHRKKMLEDALSQSGEAEWGDDEVIRPHKDQKIASAVLDGYEDYAGYTGPVAATVSKRASKPAIVFAHKGVDEHGQEIYKFSGRNDTGVPVKLGELIENPKMQEVCTLKSLDERGEVLETPVIGGHDEVCSGAVTAENREKMLEIVEDWMAEQEKDWRASGASRSFWPRPSKRQPDVTERLVDPSRLSKIERDAAQLGPYDRRAQLIRPPSKSRSDKKKRHTEPQISMRAELSELTPDPDSDRYLMGVLTFEDGQTREARFPAELDPPKGLAEWLLRVDGSPSPYYLRHFWQSSEERAAG